MASSGSTNIDNTKEQNIRKSIFNNVKKLEEIQEEANAYTRKVSILVDLWKNVASFSEFSHPRHTDKVVEWVYFQTVHLVLEGRWLDLADDQRTSIHQSVSNIIDDMMKKTKNRIDGLTAFTRLLGLQNLIINPWRHPTLIAMFKVQKSVPLEEVLAFLCSERGHLLVTRLDILCESRCEDLALRLAEACLKCIRLPGTHTLKAHVSQDQTYYIIDVYLALLHKFDRTQDCIIELNKLTLEEGLDCIRRFSTKQTDGIRIWKHCFKIAELASQVFVVLALTKSHQIGCGNLFCELMTEWASLQKKHYDQTLLPAMVRKLVQCADSATHIYAICQILNKQFGDVIRILLIELYIRAITTDMNVLEKDKTEGCLQKVNETECRLSRGFLALAELLKDEIGVCRECVLTAFSLNPSEECYKKVEEMAVISGKSRLPESITEKQNTESTETLDTGQLEEWKCHLHPPYNETELQDNTILDLCSECGEFRLKIKKPVDCSLDALISLTGHSITQSINYDVLFAPSQVLDPLVLNLPPNMCEDLAVIISSPRAKMLSWVLEWSELCKACESYVNDRQCTNRFNKELKYLNIDYSQFKDWPAREEKTDIYYGIEKGYENCLEIFTDNSQDTKYSETTDSQDISKIKGFRRNKTRILDSEESSNCSDVKAELYNCLDDVQSQNSPSDSLGSDGLQNSNSHKRANISKTIRTLKSNGDSRYSMTEIKSLSHNIGQYLVNGDSILKNDVNQIATILSPDKKSSDPKVLQSLRKYRPHVKPRAVNNKIEENQTIIAENVNQFAPMLSEVNLNPRVILNRYSDTKAVKKKAGDNSSHKIISNNINKKYCDSNQRGNYESKSNISTRKDCNILAGIPGLSSFDMIIPEKVQPVVQIVQLAQNTNKQPTSTVKVSRSSNQTNISTIITPMPSTSSDTTRITIDSSSSQQEALSTPVTPHIQRVGQATLNCNPAQLISPTTISSTTPTSLSSLQLQPTSSTSIPDLVSASQALNVVPVETSASFSSSQSLTINSTAQATPVVNRQKIINPSLANLLTNRIVMPTKSAIPPKSNPTIINVLSQKILRPLFSSHSLTHNTSLVSTVQSSSPAVCQVTTSSTLPNSIQAQSSSNVSSPSQTPQQLLQILNSPQKQSSQVVKGVNLISSLSGQPDSKMLQFICKTDGKTFQLTPYSTNTANVRIQQVDANRTFKSLSETQIRPRLEVASSINTRSVYEENYAKFIQTANKASHIQHNTTKQSSTTDTTSIINSNQNASLPKFNQAFGKTAYHSSSHVSGESGNEGDGTNITGNSAITNLPVIKTFKSDPNDNSILNTAVQNSMNPVIIKHSTLPNSTSMVTTLTGSTSRTSMTPLSVQTVHGGVIYTRQIPISTGPLFSSVKTSETQTMQTVPMVPVAIPTPLVASKSSVIRSKVNTILTATFNAPVVTTNIENSTNTSFASQTPSESCDVNSSSDDAIRTSLTQPLYALQTSLPIKLAVPSNAVFTNAKVVRPVVQIPSKILTTTSPIKQQLILTAAPTSTARMCQNVRLTDNLISSSHMDTSVSSSTLEQLREFDMVLEQVKERSTVQPNLPVSIASTLSVSSNISHGLLIPHSQSNSTDTELPASNATFGQEVVFTTTVSPLTQRLNLTYMSQNLAKIAASTPVVVVTNYQQAPSPALSITSQSSSSPCVTPAPTTPNSSAGKTTKITSKSKSKSVKSNSTNTSKASPIPKPPQKPQEDEQTAQRIYDILAEYAEQLRNSPDLNNKPAPRRRSNPSANSGQNLKRKKTSSSKRPSGQGTSTGSEMSPGADDHHTMGSEDSSCGLVQISMQNSPSQGIPSVEECMQGDASCDIGNIRSAQSDSSDCPTTEVRSQTSARHLIFTDPNNTQQRNVIIAETAVGEALAQVGKYGTSTAAVLVPGNYILPMSMVKGGQQITIVSGGSKILATVPGRTGTNANTLVLQSIINQAQKPLLAQQGASVKIPAMQTISGLTQQPVATLSNHTSIVQAMSSASQLGHQLSYIDSTPDEDTTSSTSTVTPQSAILLNSNPSKAVVYTSPSKICSTNVTGFISKSPSVIRTYSTITHTSGTSNSLETSQNEVVNIKDNYRVIENGKLKLNRISEAIVTADNTTENQGRYTLSIAPQTVVCQNAFHGTRSLISDKNTTKVKPPLKHKCSNDGNVSESQLVMPTADSTNIVMTPNLSSNPIVKLNSSGRCTQNANTEIFDSSTISNGQQRIHSILTNMNDSVINGPLLSQVSDTVRQGTPTSINCSVDNAVVVDGDRNKIKDLQKDHKVENGIIDHNEIFTKESIPWRYIPTPSGAEYLAMGDQIKLFRDTDANADSCEHGSVLQMMDKSSDEIGITKTFQIHMQPELVRKRFVNSMISSSYAAKPERLKSTTSRMSKQLHQQTLERKQAAMERELRLQKSLSEECEDLGVDEPSTSDLFPEADLLFDPTHSFDQNSQDATCSQTVVKNYSRSSFKPLDSSSNSSDADFVKVAPEKVKISNNPGQSDSFLMEHQKSKISPAEERCSTGASLRSPSTIYIDQSRDDKKGTSLSDFDNNTELLFNSALFSRSVDDSCMELVFDSTDKKINKNRKNNDCLHITQNSNSASYESSGEQNRTEPSPDLPSHTTSSKFHCTFTDSEELEETPEKLIWETMSTEDEMQFTEDDSSQFQLDNFQGTNVDNEEPILKSMLRKPKQDTLEGNGLVLSTENLPNTRPIRTECVMTNKKRSSSQSTRMVQHVENDSTSPTSPLEELSEETNKGSTRRLSLRGHVKKNCPCCNGTTIVDAVPVVKKARTKPNDHFKPIKVNKKPSVTSKSNKSQISKKR